jgi:hypothetical protein
MSVNQLDEVEAKEGYIIAGVFYNCSEYKAIIAHMTGLQSAEMIGIQL